MTSSKIYKETIESYDRYHQVYDAETTEFWDKFPKKIIKEFINKLQGKKVLDLGSGPGRDAKLLRDNNIEVLCFDASEQMIKRTKELGFESILGDMNKLDFSDKSFDGVWAFTSLLHITEIQMRKVLEKIHKVLKPGGILFLGMIDGEFEGEVVRENMPGAKRYFHFYTDKQLKSILEDTGFKFEYQNRYIPHSKSYICQIYSIMY